MRKVFMKHQKSNQDEMLVS